MKAVNWLAAWLLFILLIVVIMQTKAGNTLVNYLAWLAVIFLIVTHYSEISGIFQAGGITPQSSST